AAPSDSVAVVPGASATAKPLPGRGGRFGRPVTRVVPAPATAAPAPAPPEAKPPPTSTAATPPPAPTSSGGRKFRTDFSCVGVCRITRSPLRGHPAIGFAPRPRDAGRVLVRGLHERRPGAAVQGGHGPTRCLSEVPRLAAEQRRAHVPRHVRGHARAVHRGA